MPVNFQCSAVPFMANKGSGSFFLVCALHPLFFNGSSSRVHQMFIWSVIDSSSLSPPISYICGHLGANFIFSFVHSSEWSFQWIFFKFTPKIHCTKIITPIYFCHPFVPFMATRGQLHFSFVCSFHHS